MILLAGVAGLAVLLLGGLARVAYRLGWDERGRDAEREVAAARRDAFEAGHAAGGDDLSHEIVQASLAAPDAVEMAWPVSRRAPRLPS